MRGGNASRRTHDGAPRRTFEVGSNSSGQPNEERATIPLFPNNLRHHSTRLLRARNSTMNNVRRARIPSGNDVDPDFREYMIYLLSFGDLHEEAMPRLGEQDDEGLTEEAIMAKLEIRKYRGKRPTPPEGADICCVCQMEYAKDESVGKLDCGHEHHVDCIKKWLEIKNICPICNKTALVI